MLILLVYLILWIVGCVVILSASGTSLGLREKCANGILKLFQLAAEYDAAVELHAGKGSDSRQSSANNSFSQDDDYENYVSDYEADEDWPLGGPQDLPEVIAPELEDGSLDKGYYDAISPSWGQWNSPRRASKANIIRQNSSGELAIIDRRWSSSLDRKLRSRSPSRDAPIDRARPPSDDPELDTLREIILDTGLFISAGIEAIIEDEVTSRFKAAQLPSWNFLSRSRAAYRVSWKMTAFWFVGWMIRYFVFFPIRMILFCIAGALLIVVPALIGCIPDEKLRDRINRPAMLMVMSIAARAFSAIVTFHDTKNRPTHGICVANHTSPIDVMNLSCDNCYAMIGQRQGGFLGLLQQSLSRSAHHIWFERSEAKDRKKVSHRLREHVNDPNKLPILIFPEGTCINNTSVMLFKKGSFEISTTIYPIAIRYDNRLSDAFWNSHEQGYFAYLLSMMTAWAMVCHVWYLPPVTRKDSETPIDFARRVQRIIAKAGGLIDLEWDGNLKRSQVPERLKAEQKQLFYRYLTRTTALCECGKKSSLDGDSFSMNNSDSTVSLALSRSVTEAAELEAMTRQSNGEKEDDNGHCGRPILTKDVNLSNTGNSEKEEDDGAEVRGIQTNAAGSGHADEDAEEDEEQGLHMREAQQLDESVERS